MFEVVALENVYYWHVSLTGRASSILHDGLNDADLKASKYCPISRIKKQYYPPVKRAGLADKSF